MVFLDIGICIDKQKYSMKGFIEYLLASIEEVEKEFEQDFKKEIEEWRTSNEVVDEIVIII